MKLKTEVIEDKTYALVVDGKPVYEIDGNDVPFDAVSTVNKITALNGESQGQREAKEALEADKATLETELLRFKDIEDPVAALKAIETVASFDSSQLIDVGKADDVRAAAVKTVEEKMAAALAAKDELLEAAAGDLDVANGLAAKLSTDLNSELISGNFVRSQYVADNVVVPADMLQAMFGKHFKVEDGKVAAFGNDGKALYSKSIPGEPASFDDAIKQLVEGYPSKDKILKGANQNGSGAENNGDGDGGSGGDKTITRAEFDKIPPSLRGAKLISEGYTLVD